MDKKLLLTIQSVCNAEGVKIPWDKVGAIMGQHISDGAVIQHLAKLRTRMVAQGLDVPPPLRRGGGTIISTGPSGGGTSGTKSKPIKSAKPTSKKGRSDAFTGDEEDDEIEYDVDRASDSEEEYDQARSKQSKRDAIRKQSFIKREDDEFSTPTKVIGSKRKRKSSSFQANEGKKNKTKDTSAKKTTATPIKSEDQTTNSTVKYTGTDEDSSDNDDRRMKENEGSEEYVEAGQYVGSGAHYLRLESQSKSPIKDSTLGLKQAVSDTPSKIVVLPLPGHRRYSGPEQYPHTPEYYVQSEPDSEAGADHILSHELAGDDITLKKEDLTMESAMKMRPTLDMNSNLNMRSAFNASSDQHPSEYPFYERPHTPYHNSFVSSMTAGYPSVPKVNNWISNLSNSANDDHVHQECLTNNQDVDNHADRYGNNGSISAYDTMKHDNFNYSSADRTLEESLPVGNPKTPTSRTDFGSPSTGQAFSRGSQSRNPLQENSSFCGPGGYQHLHSNQDSSIHTASISPFDYSGFEGRVAHNRHPAFETNFDFLNGSREASQYATEGSKTFEPNFAMPLQPARRAVMRPTVVTRQPDLPTVSSEPFSSTSTKSNPTPVVATAGDANGEPVLDFAHYLHDDMDESLMIPMSFADMAAEFDKKDCSTGHNAGEDNGGVV